MIKRGNPLIQQALLASVFLFAALGFGLIAEHKGLMGDNALFSGGATGLAVTAQSHDENRPQGKATIADYGIIEGYACDQDNPSAQLQIDVWDRTEDGNNVHLGSTTANKQVSYSGMYPCSLASGFEFVIPATVQYTKSGQTRTWNFYDGRTHQITVNALNVDSGSATPRSTDQIDDTYDYGHTRLLDSTGLRLIPIKTPKAPTAAGYDEVRPVGKITSSSTALIYGWTCDGDDLTRKIRVDIWDVTDASSSNNFKVAEAIAQQTPAVTVNTGSCPKASSFQISIPSKVTETKQINGLPTEITHDLYDGKQHKFRVFGINIKNGQAGQADRVLDGEVKQNGVIISGWGHTLLPDMNGNRELLLNFPADQAAKGQFSVDKACGFVEGWACDPDRDDHLTIEIFKGAHFTSEGTTISPTQHRVNWPGITAQGCLSDKTGFSIPLPESFKTGNPETITVKATSINPLGEPTTSVSLTWWTDADNFGSSPITCAAPVIPATDTNNPIGAITKADCTGIYGWACDKDKNAAQVNVWLNPSPLGSGTYDKYVKADSSHADTNPTAAAAACGGSTAHGFYIPISQVLDTGKSATIRLNGENINSKGETAKRGAAHAYLAIDSTGKSAGPCAAPGTVTDTNTPIGDFTKADCTGVYGWACDKDKPTQQIDVIVWEVDRPNGGQAQVVGAGLLKTSSSVEGTNSAEAAAQCGDSSKAHGFYMPLPASLKDSKAHSLEVHSQNIDSTGAVVNPSRGAKLGDKKTVVCSGQPQPMEIQFTATGTKLNEYPLLDIYVGGVKQMSQEVRPDTGNFGQYSFSTVSYQPGKEVAIFFKNYESGTAAATTVKIDNIIIGTRTIRPGDPALIYDLGDDFATATNGQGIKGNRAWQQEGYVMKAKGALRVDSGITAAADLMPSGDITKSACDALEGWACDGDRPESYSTVQFWEGTTKLYEMPASSTITGSENAKTACGSSNADHGFSVPSLSQTIPALFNNNPRTIKAFTINLDSEGNQRTTDQDGGRVLIKTINMPACSMPDCINIVDRERPKGEAKAEGCQIKGWACDPDYVIAYEDSLVEKTSRVQIDFWEGNVHVGTQMANLPMTGSDAAKPARYCPGAGVYHGYLFDASAAHPSLRDGRPHQIKVYAINKATNGCRKDDLTDTSEWGHKILGTVEISGCSEGGAAPNAITVRAKGERGGNEWPTMIVTIGNAETGRTEIGRQIVDSAEYKDYTFQIASYTQGREVAVQFINDWFVPLMGDRNLYVEYIDILNSRISANNPQLIYDMGKDNYAFDGRNVATARQRVDEGYESMKRNGAFRVYSGVSVPATEVGIGRSDSCQGICNEKAEQGCWCDAQCLTAGDCCDDYGDKCTGANAPPASSPGSPPFLCSSQPTRSDCGCPAGETKVRRDGRYQCEGIGSSVIS